MRQTSAQRSTEQYGGPDARELGWDESLYEHGGDGGDPGELPDTGPPAGAASADGGNGSRHGGRRGRGSGRARRVLKWTAIVLAVAILATAGAGYLYYRHLSGNLEKDELNLGENRLDKSAPNADGNTPLNILLLGSDSRNSEENVELGGARDNAGRKPLADVQMLLHVSADRSNMSVVSVPRDTRVTIPKCTDPEDGTVYPETSATINSSLQHGGPGCTVATWEELTGVPIDHFMMIDFAGVVDMADAVGGVPVCVRANVQDPKSGLRLEKGETTVKGEQALQWLRTRHGFENGSDIGRAKAQHMYMNSMVRQLKAGTKLTNPGKLRNLAEAATKALTVDPGLGTVGKLYDLGNDLKRVPTARITMTTMPWTEDPQNPLAHLVPKPGDADKVFSLIRNDIALDGKDKKKAPEEDAESSDPAAPRGEIPVTVQNGTGTVAQAPVTGRAAEVTAELGRLGFARAAADATPKSQADTTVSYPSDDLRGDAEAVAKALGLPRSAVRVTQGVEEVTLVVGADWRTGAKYPEKPESGEEDNKAPESADPLNGDDKSACMDVNPEYTF
ncbi:LCP family protein [Streptomyces sp. NPDC048845]|uniref:LCP family protein n=1 Tax=Streptomyces sp. NPDC048845 TaxID=3155390 RepID=UPI0034217D63